MINRKRLFNGRGFREQSLEDVHHEGGADNGRQEIDDGDGEETGDDDAGEEDPAAPIAPERSRVAWRQMSDRDELEILPAQ